jgi:acetyl-CoA carboxylase carboxyl transferase subunit alpha
MTAYEKVSAARAKGRATAVDYINNVLTGFIEMHGDRRFGDDRSIITGIGYLTDRPVTVIGIEKGHNVKERALRNSGAAHPEGYRKALRQMKLAEKFKRPVVCFVDTPGAFCGIGAEERGQGQAIAENLMEMMALRVPVISVIIGEGGSGGALGLAVADEVWMLENAVYSVISPEGCASILWKDSSRSKEACECLKLTAADLLGFNVIDRIIPEDDKVYSNIKEWLTAAFTAGQQLPGDTLAANRYERFRRIGVPN